MADEALKLTKTDKELINETLRGAIVRISVVEHNIFKAREDLSAHHDEFMKLNYDVIQIAKHLKDLTESTSLLMNIISLTHMRDADNRCVPNCIGCCFSETAKGFKTAEKLMEVTNAP